MSNIKVTEYALHLDKDMYRGWTIDFRPVNKPFPYEFDVMGLCFGYLHATKDEQEGQRLIVQPVWLTYDEVRACKTPLDNSSALDSMMSNGKRLIKISIDKFCAGLITTDILKEVKPMNFGQSDTPFSVGPNGANQVASTG